MQTARKPYVVYNLRETYAELGNFEFKIVIDPKFFKGGILEEIYLVDSDMKPIKHEVRKWGRKVNLSFTIDGTVADGVASCHMRFVSESGMTIPGKVIFWVIK